jgi:hypothetical protein
VAVAPSGGNLKLERVMRTAVRSPRAIAALLCLAVLAFGAAWLLFSQPGETSATAPSGGLAPSTQPSESPPPTVRTSEPMVQIQPEPRGDCPDAEDVQVYARPYSPPSPQSAPRASSRAFACPAH